MSKARTQTALVDFERMSEQVNDAELGAIVREYIAESNHPGRHDGDSPTAQRYLDLCI